MYYRHLKITNYISFEQFILAINVDVRHPLIFLALWFMYV